MHLRCGLLAERKSTDTPEVTATLRPAQEATSNDEDALFTAIKSGRGGLFVRMRCKVASSHYRHTHTYISINILTLFLCSFAFTCRCKTNTNKCLCSHNEGGTIPVHRNTTPAKLSQDKTRAGSAYHHWTLTSQSSLVLTYRARESSDFKKESCDSESLPLPVSLPPFIELAMEPYLIHTLEHVQTATHKSTLT